MTTSKSPTLTSSIATALDPRTILALAAISLACAAAPALALAQTTPPTTPPAATAPAPGLDFGAGLSAAQEVRGTAVTGPFTPATFTSAATGTGRLLFEPDLSAAQLDLTVTGLQFPVADAHIHCGRAGQNGPILVPLSPTTGGTSVEIAGQEILNADIDNAVANGECVTACGFALTNIAALRAAAANGCLYLNVHTTSTDTQEGEVRGQLIANPVEETTPPATGGGTTGGGTAGGGTTGGETTGGGTTGGGTTGGGTTGGGTTGGGTTTGGGATGG